MGERALVWGGWVQESSPLPKLSSYHHQTTAKYTKEELLPICLLSTKRGPHEARSVMPGDLPQGYPITPSAHLPIYHPHHLTEPSVDGGNHWTAHPSSGKRLTPVSPQTEPAADLLCLPPEQQDTVDPWEENWIDSAAGVTGVSNSTTGVWISLTASILAQIFKEGHSSMHYFHMNTLHMQQGGLERELDFLQLFLQAQIQKVPPFKKYRSFWFWQYCLSEEGGNMDQKPYSPTLQMEHEQACVHAGGENTLGWCKAC